MDLRCFNFLSMYDIVRVWKMRDVYKRQDEAFADISKISQMAQPTATELRRYKLWLDQKYRSPYTGKFISLSKLFTSAYQIEHVIPQSRYFDDSFSNKVICEAEVNRLKSNMLGYEFIKAHGGEIVHCTMLGDVKILNESEYKAFVNEHYINLSLIHIYVVVVGDSYAKDIVPAHSIGCKTVWIQGEGWTNEVHPVSIADVIIQDIAQLLQVDK